MTDYTFTPPAPLYLADGVRDEQAALADGLLRVRQSVTAEHASLGEHIESLLRRRATLVEELEQIDERARAAIVESQRLGEWLYANGGSVPLERPLRPAVVDAFNPILVPRSFVRHDAPPADPEYDDRGAVAGVED